MVLILACKAGDLITSSNPKMRFWSTMVFSRLGLRWKYSVELFSRMDTVTNGFTPEVSIYFSANAKFFQKPFLKFG